MKIIIDTHIFLWALAEPHKLSDENRSELVDLSNTIYLEEYMAQLHCYVPDQIADLFK